MNFLSLQQTALVVPSHEQKKRKKEKKKTEKKPGSFKNHQTYQKKITKMIEE